MNRVQRLIAGIYSRSAERLYEPIVVRRAFPLLGGALPELAIAQGRRAVETATGGPILDLPVGTGYFTTRFGSSHPGLLVGADIAWGMVERTAQTARERGHQGLVAIQANAHGLPFSDGAFDAVVCHNGLQVIPKLEVAASELHRVLAPGATLYVTVLTLPIASVIPVPTGALPTVLRSGLDVATVISETGLYVTTIERSRFATAFEAVKPTS